MIELGHAGCVADVVELHEILAARHVHLSDAWPVDDTHGTRVDSDDPFAKQLPDMDRPNTLRKSDTVLDLAPSRRPESVSNPSTSESRHTPCVGWWSPASPPLPITLRGANMEVTSWRSTNVFV